VLRSQKTRPSSAPKANKGKNLGPEKGSLVTTSDNDRAETPAEKSDDPPPPVAALAGVTPSGVIAIDTVRGTRREVVEAVFARENGYRLLGAHTVPLKAGWRVVRVRVVPS
jgi:hypothetical protein